MISVRMLGVLTISIQNGCLPEDVGPTARRLAAYLFEFPGRVHRRERLVDQFWSHLDPPRARSAMNTALWRIRKLLAREPQSNGGRNLRSHGSDVILEQAPWLDIDTHAFNAAVQNALDRRSSQRDEARLNTLELAVAKYSGPFFDGEDADWIVEERERLHTLYVRALSELMRIYAGFSRYEEAIASARQILAVDPFRESVQNGLSLLLVLNGQPAEALRRQERWRTFLNQELGINPMPETIRMADEIRSGEIFAHLDRLKAQHFAAQSHQTT